LLKDCSSPRSTMKRVSIDLRYARMENGKKS
jgi:hypothetical protein